MSNRVKPTEKQKRAFKELVENGSTKKEAMIKAGYSENTAKAPTKMTDSKGWENLMAEYLPDDLLSKVHNEGLEATKGVFKNNNETKKVERVDEEPDFGVRHKYLDTAYKLKNKYPAVKQDITSGGEKIYNWESYGKDNNIPSKRVEQGVSREQEEVEGNSSTQEMRKDNSES